MRPQYLPCNRTDLGTRNGLKKVHTNFSDIFKKLDSAYVGAQRRSNEKLMGGIVGIWAKMCADAILRDKLFQEGAPTNWAGFRICSPLFLIV